MRLQIDRKHDQKCERNDRRRIDPVRQSRHIGIARAERQFARLPGIENIADHQRNSGSRHDMGIDENALHPAQCRAKH